MPTGGGKGRDTVFTKDCIQKLEDAYLCDATHAEAAIYADIGLSTLMKYRSENPDFVDKTDKLRGMTGLKAKINVKNSIDDGNINDSKWYLERRDDEYKPKQKVDTEITGNKSLIDAILAAKSSRCGD